MTEQVHYVHWVAKLFPPQGEWTEEDYFSLPETNMIIELSQGEIRMSPPPTPPHQRCLRRLTRALEPIIEDGDLGEIFFAPVAVKLWEGNIRQPDALFIKKEHSDRIKATMIEGSPDWVAEIISPRSRKIDTQDKLTEYAQAGIPEYWILDSKYKNINVYVLKGGVYELHATYRAGATAEAVTIPGFRIAVDEVFRL